MTLNWLRNGFISGVITLIALSSFVVAWAEWVPPSIPSQGFSRIEERSGGMDFSCSAQCFILTGSGEIGDYIHLEGMLSGVGNIGYAFLVGSNVIPGEFVPVNGTQKLGRDFLFHNSQYFSQASLQSPKILIVVDGKIDGSGVSFSSGTLSLPDQIATAWSDFWTFDSFRPYTINLLYGPKAFGSSINGILYLILFLGALLLGVYAVVTYRGALFWKRFAILVGVIWIAYDLRMSAELISYYMRDYRDYIAVAPGQRTFRDRSDFYDFMDFARTTLHVRYPDNNISVSIFTDRTWPFVGSAKYFLAPLHVEEAKPDAKVFLFHTYRAVTMSGGVLQVAGVNVGKGEFIPFSQNGGIFIKQ